MDLREMKFANPQFNLGFPSRMTRSNMVEFANKEQLIDAYAINYAREQEKTQPEEYFGLYQEGLQRAKDKAKYNPQISNAGFYIENFGFETSRRKITSNIKMPEDWKLDFIRKQQAKPAPPRNSPSSRLSAP